MPFRGEQTVTVAGAAAAEALVADHASRLAVILTHPWGPLGGNLHNNVVAAAALYFQNLQITTLRFNFSSNSLSRGHAQVQQVQDIAAQLLAGEFVRTSNNSSSNNNGTKPTHILLVGYSYGSLISLSASANIPQCVGVVSIAPPFGVQHWLLLFNANFHLQQAAAREDLPRLFLIGTRDNFTSEARFKTVLEERFPNDTGAVLKDADHFFARREKDVMDVIGEWLLKTFPSCEGDLRALRDVEFI